MKFLSKVGLGPVSRWFHFGGDPGWPSLSFRGQSRPARSLWHKIDCSRKHNYNLLIFVYIPAFSGILTRSWKTDSGKRHDQSYYTTLIGSRMCSVNGAILDDLGAHFKIKPGDNIFPSWKTIPLSSLSSMWNLCLLQRPPPCFLLCEP